MMPSVLRFSRLGSAVRHSRSASARRSGHAIDLRDRERVPDLNGRSLDRGTEGGTCARCGKSKSFCRGDGVTVRGLQLYFMGGGSYTVFKGGKLYELRAGAGLGDRIKAACRAWKKKNHAKAMPLFDVVNGKIKIIGPCKE